MVTADPAKHLQDEVTCSICLDYFKDPVMITECQHDFCRACVTMFWKRPGASICCPDCRRKASWQSLKPNRRLANMVEAAKQLSLQLEQSPGREKMCKEHKKPLSLFCKTENTLICMFCERSKAHRNHSVISAERAAADYKFSAAASPPRTRTPHSPLAPVVSMPPASRAAETASTAADRSGSNAFSLMGTAQNLPPSPSPDSSSTQGRQQVLHFSSSAGEEPPRKRFKKCPAKKHPCKKRHRKSSKCRDSDSRESTSDSDSMETTSDSFSSSSSDSEPGYVLARCRRRAKPASLVLPQAHPKT